jgi:hypothetical protein
METTIKDVRNYEEKHGNGNGGFTTPEQANEYAQIRCAWWGSNLVYLGCSQKEDGFFYPGFNVFD